MGFLKVLPPVFIFEGCDFSFLFFKYEISCLIFAFSLYSPLKEALKKIKSFGKLHFLYSNFISLDGIVRLFQICLILAEIKISFISLPKHPCSS